MKFHLNLKLAF